MGQLNYHMGKHGLVDCRLLSGMDRYEFLGGKITRTGIRETTAPAMIREYSDEYSEIKLLKPS